MSLTENAIIADDSEGEGQGPVLATAKPLTFSNQWDGEDEEDDVKVYTSRLHILLQYNDTLIEGSCPLH